MHGVILPGVRADPDYAGHDAGDFRRGVELPLALARLGREVPHEVLVRVAQEVVAVGAVGAEVEPLEDPDQLREAVLHLLALAELALVVEIGLVDHPLEEEIVGVGEPADDLVDPVTDLLGPLEIDHVGEASPGRHRDVGEVAAPGVLVRDVLHEEQREDVVLVLGRVHAAAQLVAALPERGVEVGFSEGHGGWREGSIGGWRSCGGNDHYGPPERASRTRETPNRSEPVQRRSMPGARGTRMSPMLYIMSCVVYIWTVIDMRGDPHWRFGGQCLPNLGHVLTGPPRAEEAGRARAHPGSQRGVSPIQPDVGVIDGFRTRGWRKGWPPSTQQRRMHSFAIR